ncbi:MAG: site-specific integrase [Bacteroidaceae bacterium]|nr:site-specific integrase [Bacteroidaceae bacterium]MBR1449516.1 site-specific integrase [Prevotella sp.]
MFKFYTFVDTKKMDDTGESPVYIVVRRKGGGRFWLSTGLMSRGKLDGLSFSAGTTNGRQRTMVLCRYLQQTELVLQREDVEAMTDAEVKQELLERVFGVMPKARLLTLAENVAAFAETKRESTRVLYGITERKVAQFDARATLESVDGQWLERFRQWCLDKGMRINGAGKELRNIRAVFNWARRQGRTANYPFLDYSIVEEETMPNNISVEQLRQLRDYACEPWQEKYRDFFMLSFYLAGMNPVDLLTCRADAVKDGHLHFVRQKTNKQGQRKVRAVVLPVVAEAEAIISRYRSVEGWLLSFVDGRTDYHSFLKKANEALKKIGPAEIVPDRVGKMRKVVYHPILPDITMYTARYTFGSIAANDLDISERTIGMCLGHSWSKNVTSRYMANDQRKVDMAVMRVVEYVGAEAAVVQQHTEP